MTITPKQEQAIRDKLAEMPRLSVGVGNEKSACSVAAINLALTGELTDDIPDCMSEVVGCWIVAMQDKMPASIRNSSGWRELLPLAAGTGREHEKERLKIITDWAWGLLARLQPLADRNGFGVEWRRMRHEQTITAINATYRAINNSHAHAALAITNTDALIETKHQTNIVIAAVTTAVIVGGWNQLDPIGLLRKLVES